jgi:NADH dehydrogenase
MIENARTKVLWLMILLTILFTVLTIVHSIWWLFGVVPVALLVLVGVYAVGDVAQVTGPDGDPYPQLGSVALQAGQAVAASILADIAGKRTPSFHYHDKGIMAMIGRRAAIAEMGAHRHELHGPVAFSAWLGVHAWLLSTNRARIDAFMNWAWDSFSKSRSPAIIDDPDAPRIDWGDDDLDDQPDPSSSEPKVNVP